MNLQDWKHIQKIAAAAQQSSMHCSIATVDQNLQPTITPIGTLFLHEATFSGFFFDTYLKRCKKIYLRILRAAYNLLTATSCFGFGH